VHGFQQNGRHEESVDAAVAVQVAEREIAAPPKAEVETVVEENGLSDDDSAQVEPVQAEETQSDEGSAGGETMTDEFAGKQAADEAVVATAEGPVASKVEAVNHPAARVPAGDGDSPLDAREELQKVLKVRRWDERSSPFNGFDSPPGRF
jgi:hypothetical protein